MTRVTGTNKMKAYKHVVRINVGVEIRPQLIVSWYIE